MTPWQTIELVEGPAAGFAVDLPPGWWWLRPSEIVTDVAAAVATATSALPPRSALPAQLGDELSRFARVSAAAGAVLVAGGSAFAGDDGALVMASLAMIPYEVYLTVNRSGQEAGPVDRLNLQIGPTLRSCWLGPALLPPIGTVVGLELSYVLAPPTGSSAWVLMFRTPALRHTGDLVRVFDSIAQSVRTVEPAPIDVAAAFS